VPYKAPIVEQFRYARFTPEDYIRDQILMRAVDQAPCITFGQLRVLAKRQGWTVDSLAAFVKGELDEPKRTLDRLLKTGPADTVIPYTCLLQLYEKATAIPQARPGEKSCSCGCGGKSEANSASPRQPVSDEHTGNTRSPSLPEVTFKVWRRATSAARNQTNWGGHGAEGFLSMMRCSACLPSA
jgi:hypothetical protein